MHSHTRAVVSESYNTIQHHTTVDDYNSEWSMTIQSTHNISRYLRSLVDLTNTLRRSQQEAGPDGTGEGGAACNV